MEKQDFSGVNIEAGVNYFLWDKDYNGLCSLNGGKNYDF